MALNTLKCNHLMPLPFKGLIQNVVIPVLAGKVRLLCVELGVDFCLIKDESLKNVTVIVSNSATPTPHDYSAHTGTDLHPGTSS